MHAFEGIQYLAKFILTLWILKYVVSSFQLRGRQNKASIVA